MEPMLALLVDCCRPRLSDAELAKIGERLAVADGARFALLARRHRVEGLAWRTVQRIGVVPLGLGKLGEDARHIAADGLVMAVESARVHRTFAAASIPHLFLKGQTLGVLAWDNPMLKRQLDIDLLVPGSAIGRSAALLAGLGYVQQVPEPSVDPSDWHRSRKESMWRSDDGILLDLHSRVADHSAILPTVTATVPARMVKVAGGVELPTLPERLLLPYLAVHGFSSAWFRLKWLADFAALVSRTAPAELARAAEQAPRLGAGRTLAAALVLSNRVMGTPLPAELEHDSGSRTLVKLALAALNDPREPTERAFGTLGIHRSQLLMVPGSHFFMSEAVRQLGALLTH
ncbi:hypothetical protein GCM10007925_07470 [Sphingomonas astaxanthinifaciens DSM 22298]|uniref:Nucleotidyltransferase family protein n=2 Tax=Sphingomonas TaxID=13687 RepID=A0ABQ5Z669_9SPHN|nr:hypothetical protein GCM10007925_07470 [Sphingomonas astaxanthinifaciens DSM 22298]